MNAYPLWLQIKFAKTCGERLDKFKIIGHQPFTAFCRCPICGDSQKSETKRRFYMYVRSNSLLVICHNCSYSTTFSNFLRGFDESLHKSYIFEAFQEQPQQIQPQAKTEEVVASFKWKDSFIPIRMSTKAVNYLKERKIPESQWNRLFYTQDLRSSIVDIYVKNNMELPEKTIPQMEGIFIPFIDKKGRLFCSTTRNLDSASKFRYATITFDETVPKVFGLDTIDQTKSVYVTEGPIDSIFIKNCVATGDASLNRAAQHIPKENLVLIPDNEPRAKVQVGRIESFINDGFSVVLFPDNIEEKDINDMVKAGIDVEAVIRINTFKGLAAKLRFSQWKKI